MDSMTHNSIPEEDSERYEQETKPKVDWKKFHNPFVHKKEDLGKVNIGIHDVKACLTY